jgi:hypothetical protein
VLHCEILGGLAHGLVLCPAQDRNNQQKKRFRDDWRALSQSAKPGRPRISRELRKLIQRMWEANPTWGSPRIVAELAMPGIEVAKSTVEKYRPRRAGPASPTWRTFLDQPVRDFVSIDFFIVPTATFPSHLIRDGDGIYGERVTRRIESLGIDEVITAPASPWQNAYVERVIGTLRRELFEHVIVLNERHLKRLMSSYLDYYHPWRTHQSLNSDAPDGRRVRAVEAEQKPIEC